MRETPNGRAPDGKSGLKKLPRFTSRTFLNYAHDAYMVRYHIRNVENPVRFRTWAQVGE